MDRCEATAFDNCIYASNLDYIVSSREETGVLGKTDETEKYCHKTCTNLQMNQTVDKQNKNRWMNQTVDSG